MTFERDPQKRLELLEASIRRMVDILDLGKWPTGLPLTVDDRRAVEWNLDIARGERTRRRRQLLEHARAR